MSIQGSYVGFKSKSWKICHLTIAFMLLTISCKISVNASIQSLNSSYSSVENKTQCYAFPRSQQRVEFKNPCSVFLSLFYLCRTCLDNFSRPLKVISLNVQLIPQFQFSFVVCQKGMILETVERNRDRIHCFARKISSGFILLSEENNENKLAYRRESMN